MTSVNMIDSKPVAVVKGTPEEVMACCVLPDTDKITAAYEQMAKTGLRVIAVAFKALDSEPTNPTKRNSKTDFLSAGFSEFTILREEGRKMPSSFVKRGHKGRNADG